MPTLRLDKILADTGCWSRKEARDLLRRNRVTVDGQPARSPEQKCDPSTQLIEVDGQSITHSTFTFLMLHKPAGVLSATEDRRQSTVLDLLPPALQRQGLFPVGRLDKDSTGLLLLTNHGELAHRLLSPRYHVDKVYLVQVEGAITQEDCHRFATGITLADGEKCLPARLDPLPNAPDWAQVTLQEGKFHQIKRMFGICKKPVLSLKRLSMGPLQLDPALSPGKYRPLTPQEVQLLLQNAGLQG